MQLAFPECFLCQLAFSDVSCHFGSTDNFPAASFPDMSGLDVAPVIRKEVPDCGILVVSQHDPEHMKPRALRAGAHGFVSKASLSKDLLAAIRALVASRSKPNNPPGGGLNEGFTYS